MERTWLNYTQCNMRYISAILLVSIFMLAPSSVVAKKSFKKPQNLTVECSGEKVEIKWKRRSGAKKYRVKVIKGSSNVIKNKKTKNKKKKFSDSTFVEDKTYRIRVRVVKTKKKKASKWAKKKYVHTSCEVVPEEPEEESFTCEADTSASPLAAVRGDISTKNSAGRDGKYYLPTGYNTQCLPVMVAFHGTGGDGNEILNFFDEYAEEYGFIIVAPDSRMSPSGEYIWEVGTIEGEITEDYTHTLNTLEEVLAKSNVYEDANHMLTAGFSAGGSYTAYLATNDDRFTHFAVLHGGIFSGGFGDEKPRAWLSTGEDDTLRIPDELSLYESTLQGLGFDVTYNVYSGGHTISSTEKDQLMSWWLN